MVRTTIETRLRVVEELREEFPADMRLVDIHDKLLLQFRKYENGTS